MGTYADWILWVGITNESYSLRELSTSAQNFIENVTEATNPIKKKGLLIEVVYMHGESVGFGTVIQRTGWEVEIGDQNLFKLEWIDEAEKARARLNRLFKILGIPKQAELYQHIDLGG